MIFAQSAQALSFVLSGVFILCATVGLFWLDNLIRGK